MEKSSRKVVQKEVKKIKDFMHITGYQKKQILTNKMLKLEMQLNNNIATNKSLKIQINVLKKELKIK